MSTDTPAVARGVGRMIVLALSGSVQGGCNRKGFGWYRLYIDNIDRQREEGQSDSSFRSRVILGSLISCECFLSFVIEQPIDDDLIAEHLQSLLNHPDRILYA